MTVSNNSHQVTVVGAGIVGICCALQLQRDGHQVTVIDPKPPGTATSFGNAGVIATGAVMPYATPGLWKDLPWLVSHPMSPLKLRWRHLHRSLPWLTRFVAEGRLARVETIAAEMAPLSERAGAAHKELIRDHSIDAGLVRPSGMLYVFEQEQRFQSTRLERELYQRHQVSCEVLGGDEIQQLEPGLAKRFQRGLFFPNRDFVTQPILLTQAYADAFRALGGEIRCESVRRFEVGPQGPTKIITDLGMYDVDRVVVAAGAWSRKLIRSLGSDVPLDTERGYHINIPWSDGVTLNRPVAVVDRYFVLAPMRDGVRVTSGEEMGGLNLPPNFRHIRRMVGHARGTLTGLTAQANREWMGYRPSIPDSKPVIGRSPHFDRVFFAFGHGHFGLTLSAVTGRAISDLVAGRDSEIPLHPFRISRF